MGACMGDWTGTLRGAWTGGDSSVGALTGAWTGGTSWFGAVTGNRMGCREGADKTGDDGCG